MQPEKLQRVVDDMAVRDSLEVDSFGLFRGVSLARLGLI